MSYVTRVPEHVPGEPSVFQIRRMLRETGAFVMLRESFVRFRFGDGFSHSRALALQLSLSIVPLVIALVGLSGTLHAERVGHVLRRTVLALAPGGDDTMLRRALADALSRQDGKDTATTALVLGLIAGMVALTTAMAQIERGANRIYGIDVDRPTVRKYGRGLVLAVTAGLPALAGFTLIVGGSVAAQEIERAYGVHHLVVIVLRWPVSLALSLGAILVLMRHAPRRRHPSGWSWLAPAAGISLVLWIVFTALLALYMTESGSFGAIYGQLTSVMALLVWAQLTSMAILFGTAVAAQLEATRAGLPAAVPQSGESLS